MSSIIVEGASGWGDERSSLAMNVRKKQQKKAL
jgi:hypothetical protein